MLLRNVYNFIFASPVTIIASVVSVACAGILIVSISSNMKSSVSTETVSNWSVSGDFNNDESSESYGEASTDMKTTSLNSEQDEGKDSAYPPRNKPQGSASDSHSSSATKRQNVNRNNTPAQNSSYRNYQEQGYSEERAVQSTTINGVSTYSKPSSLNFSNTSTTNTSATSSNSGSSTNTGSVATSGSSSSTNSGSSSGTTSSGNSSANTSITENNFPASKENEVKISIDETHYISCQPVEANGPPCMCTYTIVDADGSSSRTEDNCS